ncbi:hypothetical protein [Microscilla marina]|uniref:Uncharacterized protein n=1 Tax=Microscilla marina ATCC 23134 TaxID=313606 RepID=A1ZCX3_MICM2|nr:hypothetical protein [Microscilla marina]EAY31512.1 hypothetical protein M23134_05018 [Microscilla marina ATCC 23134]
MKKISIGLLTIGFLVMSVNTQAQKIGKIKSNAKSSSNHRKSERRSSGSGGSGSSGLSSGFNGEVCFDIFTGCLDILSTVSSNDHQNTSTPAYAPTSTPIPANKTEEKPEVVAPPPTVVQKNQATPVLPKKIKAVQRAYFQVKASYGFLPNNYEIFRPGVRARFGKKHGFGMAFDYRYNFLREKVLGDYTSYFTHDIQILQFAPETNGDVEIRVGGGFMIDEFKEFYPEILVGFSAFANNMQWKFGSELRFAPNTTSGGQAPARIEWGTNVQYALVNQPEFKLYGGIRSKVASYFGENIWSIGVGINMRIY